MFQPYIQHTPFANECHGICRPQRLQSPHTPAVPRPRSRRRYSMSPWRKGFATVATITRRTVLPTPYTERQDGMAGRHTSLSSPPANIAPHGMQRRYAASPNSTMQR
ncbi:hypothetical protein TNCT_373431 [Trichonephila clavata]|uniref:Uncharacterized protein n=1 Tax=Trichonephila clavata TaxID=2740835 RepID=A0A8X6KPX7_TRICU|nr:hypothetical protein TNCT_373431 [Trichonephila clavata]